MNKLSLLFFFVIFPNLIFSQEADKIIKKFYNTCGKQEDWKKINSMKLRSISISEANEIHDILRIEGVLYSQSEDKFLLEKIESPIEKVNMLFDGKTAYFIYKDSTYKRIKLIEQIVAQKPSIYSVNIFFGKRLYNFSEKMNNVSYVKDTSYQNKNYHILLLKENKNNIYIYINSKTGFIDFFRNKTAFVELSNYKKVGKVLIPHTKKNYIFENGEMRKDSQEDIVSIELNCKFPANLFYLETHTKK
jgi:hypothetical protein